MTAGPPGEPNLEDTLTRIPLFAEIDRVALAQLAAHLDPIVLEEGDTVCRQGEPGDCLFVLTTGQLGVLLAAPRPPVTGPRNGRARPAGAAGVRLELDLLVPLALTAAGPLPSIGATQRWFDDVPRIVIGH